LVFSSFTWSIFQAWRPIVVRAFGLFHPDLHFQYAVKLYRRGLLFGFFFLTSYSFEHVQPYDVHDAIIYVLVFPLFWLHKIPKGNPANLTEKNLGAKKTSDPFDKQAPIGRSQGPYPPVIWFWVIIAVISKIKKGVEVQFSIVPPSVDWLIFRAFFFSLGPIYAEHHGSPYYVISTISVTPYRVNSTTYSVYRILFGNCSKQWKLVPHTSSSRALRAACDLLKLGPSHRSRHVRLKVP
jgi:hypothetical protein